MHDPVSHEATREDLKQARVALSELTLAIEAFTLHLGHKVTGPKGFTPELLEDEQVLAFELASLASEAQAAELLLEHAERTEDVLDGHLAVVFAAEVGAHLQAKLLERAPLLDLPPSAHLSERSARFICDGLAPKRSDAIAKLLYEHATHGTSGLDEDHRLMQEAFRTYAERSVRPIAEAMHRGDQLIPETIIRDLAEQGAFGLAIPAEYGGFSDDPDNLGMVVATEELSRGALIAGSLITRPEILSKALLKGGTPEQKEKYLPLIASGEKMVAVAVTEPNFGSDVAGLKVVAKKVAGGYRITGTKTWCTFAGRADLLMVLARTSEDPGAKHKGLSLFIVEKPRFLGHDFCYEAQPGGRIEGRAIPTLGYRGMHSFEVTFEDVFVPDSQLIGGPGGLGRGFYLQMEGFSGGRLQTAARALGLMQAAFEQALRYASERKVFGKPVSEQGLSRYKLTRMAAGIAASRQFAYHAARLMDRHEGQTEASMVKLMACRMAEAFAREAQQLHGGMGYAEEFAVSRFFVDSRVLSIFEGAEEVLALRVIAPALIKAATERATARTSGGHR